MMPELFLADALGAAGKPISRVHTAGSVGGSTALVAADLIHAGIHERVLTVAFEKQSESNAMWALSPSIPFQPQLTAGAGGYFAPLIRAYMRRSGAPRHIGHLVSVKAASCSDSSSSDSTARAVAVALPSLTLLCAAPLIGIAR